MENIKIDDEILEFIRNGNEKFIQEDLRQFLKIASYSLNKKEILRAKEFIISYISEICDEIQVIEGEINPLIIAKVEGELEELLLIYSMYDTQPISNEEDWISPPFEAKITTFSNELSELDECIIARGAYNSKTPLLCFLNLVKILKIRKKLPISLLLIFDGEEEIGSPTLLRLLDEKKELFNNCIDAYYPSSKQDLIGKSILKLGYKGILSLTFEAKSRNKEPHSAFASLIPNPALDLIYLINKIYSNGKYHIKSLSKPYKFSKQEKTLINKLLRTVSLDQVKRKAGITQVVEDDYTKAFLNYLFNPTFNISTFCSGYMGEGTKNMVPNKAICNIDIRFAHNISIDEIYMEIDEIVNDFIKNSTTRIELTRNVSYEGSRVNLNSILVKSLIKSFEALEIPTEIWPLSAAAAPLSKIQQELEINYIVGGLGIGGFAHAPNEFIQIQSILNTRLSNYYFLCLYANSMRKSGS